MWNWKCANYVSRCGNIISCSNVSIYTIQRKFMRHFLCSIRHPSKTSRHDTLTKHGVRFFLTFCAYAKVSFSYTWTCLMKLWNKINHLNVFRVFFYCLWLLLGRQSDFSDPGTVSTIAWAVATDKTSEQSKQTRQHRAYSDGDADLVPRAKSCDLMTINMK